MSQQQSRLVWFRLVDRATRNEVGIDAVPLCSDSVVVQFRDAVKAKYADSLLKGIAPIDLLVYSKLAYEEKQEPLKPTLSIDDSFGSQNNMLVLLFPTSPSTSSPRVHAESPQLLTRTKRYYTDGLDLSDGKYLEREALLEEVIEKLKGASFVIISSPPATGKTALLELLNYRYRLNADYYRCLQSQNSNLELINQIYANFEKRKSERTASNPYYVFLDDAQNFYDDSAFWEKLMKVPVSQVAQLRFVICATHLLSTKKTTSPIEFRSFPRIEHDKLRVSDDDAFKLIDLCDFCGFSLKNYPHAKYAIVKQAAGVVGAIVLSVYKISEKFRYHFPPGNLKFLIIFFQCNLALKLEDCLEPILRRKAASLPRDIFSLVKSAIQEMSSSALMKSVVHPTDFPKETVFQHEFVSGLLASLPPCCYICAELSKNFPNDDIKDGKIEGEIDFYINGDLRWGLELLISGDNVTEHMDRFSAEAEGKYFPLQVNAYAIVDFRRSSSGKPTNVLAMENRVTVFFPHGDYSVCVCRFGTNPADIYIKLNS